MPLSGFYMRFLDVSKRDNYPNIVMREGYLYEINNSQPSERVTNTNLLCAITTKTTSVSTYNTLNAAVVNTAKEAVRAYDTFKAVYAYYDI